MNKTKNKKVCELVETERECMLVQVTYAIPGNPFHISAMMLTITPPWSFIHAE